jgi:prepilin-type N-terminal cleavage/methylation domain-containing protein/prepilin-type processing-associated H-X9-DG protein
MKKNRAFTLVELLVVIGIIAVLISLLLPSLGKARDRAKTVQCASNLRQLNLAIEMYGGEYNGYCMPSQAGTGSAQQFWWWGTEILGRMLTVKRGDGSGASMTAAVERTYKLLNCPSNDRLPAPGVVANIEYTYNGNLGDFRAHNPANAADYASYRPWAYFKRRVQVPSSVVVALDASPIVASNDDRFASKGDLTTTSSSRPFPRAGRVHEGGKLSNVLFHDGSVRLVEPFRQLQDWMIRAPREGDSPTTLDTARWRKGRVLPF